LDFGLIVSRYSNPQSQIPNPKSEGTLDYRACFRTFYAILPFANISPLNFLIRLWKSLSQIVSIPKSQTSPEIWFRRLKEQLHFRPKVVRSGHFPKNVDKAVTRS
jgi:hypothetical protein